MTNGMAAIWLIVILAAGLAALAIFSYFQAGAIGMAREILEKGSTSLETMWSVGRSHYLKMAAVNLITGLLAVVAGLALIGAYFFIVVPLTTINEPLFLLLWGVDRVSNAHNFRPVFYNGALRPGNRWPGALADGGKEH
jgi:hypothetical protein